jgi:hypothetical protein
MTGARQTIARIITFRAHNKHRLERLALLIGQAVKEHPVFELYQAIGGVHPKTGA